MLIEEFNKSNTLLNDTMSTFDAQGVIDLITPSDSQIRGFVFLIVGLGGWWTEGITCLGHFVCYWGGGVRW